MYTFADRFGVPKIAELDASEPSALSLLKIGIRDIRNQLAKGSSDVSNPNSKSCQSTSINPYLGLLVSELVKPFGERTIAVLFLVYADLPLASFHTCQL